MPKNVPDWESPKLKKRENVIITRLVQASVIYALVMRCVS